jgi:cell division protein FtsQ
MREPESDATTGTSAPAVVEEDAAVRIPDVERGVEPDPHPARHLRPVLRVDEARRRALRPWAIAGAGAVVAAVAAVGLVASPAFDADTITVSGERHLSEAQVRRVAGIDHDTNVFRVDEGAVERRLERAPWVLDARVTADLPSTIRIDLVERTPVAVASTSAGQSLVSTDGTVLGPAPVGAVFPEIRAVDAPTTRDPAATDPTADDATGSAPPVNDDVLEEGAKVAGALSSTLQGQLATIAIAPDATVTLTLDGGVPVAFGRAIELEAKAEAVTAILSYAKGEPTPLLSIDVSTPAAPTARFVGATMTTPTPEGKSEAKDHEQAPNPDATPSPSASP